MVRLIAHAVTDVGRVRDGNEDGYRIDARTGLLAVADGMGGHVGGEIASAIALEALVAAVANGRPIRDAIAEANDAVIEKADTDQNLRGMGTTLTAATLASGGTLLVGHVGDSRAYLVRAGQIAQITDDHSLVEEMVQRGQLTPEQAEVHPQRSIVTRAIGIDPDIEVDVYPVELHPGDRVLLCSDGLTDMVRAEAIGRILAREPDGQRAAEQLIDAANAAGGNDNITALVIDVVEDDGSARTAGVVAPGLVDDGTVDGGDDARFDDEYADDRYDAGYPDDVHPDEGGRRTRPGRRRGWTVLRVLAWTLPIVIVLGIAVGAIAWYARSSYYVAVDRDRITIFKGRPGGVLGWDPTVERRTQLTRADLTNAQRSDLEDEKEFSSLDDAERYVARLREDFEERTTPSTTTTVPPPTTTTAPPVLPPPAS
jgi:protein phosphatase